MFYRVAHAAKALGLHAQTVRRYEALGLIIFVRDSAGWRLVSEKDIERLRRIHAERLEGLPSYHPARATKSAEQAAMAAA